MLAPETLTAEEAAKLLECLRLGTYRRPAGSAGVRNWGMGMVLLEAGLRVGELVGLNIGDLLFRGEPVLTLIVRKEIAKRGVERGVPVSDRLRGAIGELARKVWVCDCGQVGMAAFSCGSARRRLTTRQVESIVRRAALEVLGRPVHPHVLRHTFGTRIERVAGIRVAQELLGHADVRTTQIYTHPNHDDLKRAVNGEGRGPGGGS